MVQWRGRRRSSNVEDQRSSGGGRRPGGGLAGLGGLKMKGGIGTLVILAVVYFASGGDLGQVLGVLLSGNSPGMASTTERSAAPPQNDEQAAFVSVILADTEDTWHGVFQASGNRYPEPKLRLFRDGVNSACGYNSSAVGPFYCPGDARVYLDLSFFQQLAAMGAPGDFAQAYVIGHEIGHHVQNVTGVLREVAKLKSGVSQRRANQLQVLVELQADCYAGLWAHHAETQRDLLERGDVEEGLKAAASIGDDALQQSAGRQVRPETFTHGSSQQRVAWFKRGFESGRASSCDTFRESGVALDVVTLDGELQARASRSGNSALLNAYRDKRSDVQISGAGEVRRILPDDREGSAHQRFILDIDGHSLLVAHNIDLAARIDNLRVGDRVEFNGEYEWNSRGGVLHWTHHDPAGRHIDGWLRHAGRLYQ